MADIVDVSTRSRMMSGIRGKDTLPELQVRRFLHGTGLRFLLHARHLPGRPDVVLPKHETVVFVHGCFWHRHHSCKYAYEPASNRRFWRNKFLDNVARDKRVKSQLRRAGWRVLVVWECAAGNKERLARLVTSILDVKQLKRKPRKRQVLS
jgi:DNA mismatch endonuclease (patch repair protein)